MKKDALDFARDEQEKKDILNAYRGLLRVSKRYRNPEGARLIRKAFNVALDAHKDMRRKSGEPYIYHPIAVARIVGEEIGLGNTSIICALLHDTVEDTEITLDDIEAMFGLKCRAIIDGLTKISHLDHSPSIQAENFRKMLLTLSDDVRVILIKIADRLHNMRTLESMKPEKQLKIASETKYMYAPMAHRLGLYNIKSELEDLSLKYTQPKVYQHIANKLQKTKEVRNRFIRGFINPIKKQLDQEGFSYQIKARTKSISSIWDKINKKNIPFEEIYDLFAIRIILDSDNDQEKADCWKVYSIVTDFYQPNPDRLRDWISIPRSNGYESLHTTVMSPTGQWVEVQIRTDRMDDVAEKGLAAHFRYKEQGGNESKLDLWLGEIRDLLDSSNEDAIDFIDEFKLNLFVDEIYVFTPKGELRTLPKASTALDFAFDIHTEVGKKCIGAKVNHKLVPLSHQLKSGDQVEILTSNKQEPKRDWLEFVKTARAKAKIKSALKEGVKKRAEEGKEILDRKLKQWNVPFSSENVGVAIAFYKFPGATELYYAVAEENIDISQLKALVGKDKNLHLPEREVHIQERKEKSKKDKKDELIIGENYQGLQYSLAQCCSPIPGDDVFGFVTIREGIKIHRQNCPNATQMLSKYAYRAIKARWSSSKDEEFVTGIRFVGIDDIGIVKRVTDIVSESMNINMKSISFDSEDGTFTGQVKVLIHDTNHLDNLIKELKKIKGMRRVERMEGDE